MVNWPVFRLEIEIDLTSVLRSKLTWFCVEDRNWLGFSVRTEIGVIFVRGSKLILSLCEGRKILVLSVCTDIDLVFVMAEIDLISFWGIELDLISVRGLNWFGCVGGRNWFVTCMLAENHLFSRWAWKLTWFLCGWSTLTWCQCGGSNLTWFQCRHQIDLVVVRVVEIDLVF